MLIRTSQPAAALADKSDRVEIWCTMVMQKFLVLKQHVLSARWPEYAESLARRDVTPCPVEVHIIDLLHTSH
jgi:hypothetical protein